jgi:hypothetical protein
MASCRLSKGKMITAFLPRRWTKAYMYSTLMSARAEDAHPEPQGAKIHAHLLAHFRQVQGKGRGAHRDGGGKVLEEHDLAPGLAPGDQDHRGPEALGAVVKAQAAELRLPNISQLPSGGQMGVGRFSNPGTGRKHPASLGLDGGQSSP